MSYLFISFLWLINGLQVNLIQEPLKVQLQVTSYLPTQFYTIKIMLSVKGGDIGDCKLYEL